MENNRKVLIKNSLADSLIRLLKTKTIHEISVREICKDADVNRTTFYNHFSSPYEVLTYIQNKVIDYTTKFLSLESKTESSILDNLKSMLTFTKKNLEVAKIVVNNNVDKDFAKMLLTLPQVNNVVALNFAENKNENIRSYYYTFVVAGSFNVLKEWLNNDCDVSVDEIANLLISINNQKITLN